MSILNIIAIILSVLSMVLVLVSYKKDVTPYYVRETQDYLHTEYGEPLIIGTRNETGITIESNGETLKIGSNKKEMGY